MITMEITPVKIGDAVVYVDPTAKEHSALVTASHGYFGTYREFLAWQQGQYGWTDDRREKTEQSYVEAGTDLDAQMTPPSLNVVFVSSDDTQTDPYGRQIARNTSVPHQSVQPARGMYWRNI